MNLQSKSGIKLHMKKGTEMPHEKDFFAFYARHHLGLKSSVKLCTFLKLK